MHDASSTQKDRDHLVHQYRQAKAAALKASAARREEMENDMFLDIEKNHSNSKLLWAHAKSVTGGLRLGVSPPPMTINSSGEVETDPAVVLKVWKEFSASVANPDRAEEEKYDNDYKQAVESRRPPPNKT